jgi:hypothetical protein
MGGRDRGSGGHLYPSGPIVRCARTATGGDNDLRQVLLLGRRWRILSRTRESVGHYVGLAGDVPNAGYEFGNERQLSLLAS